MATRLLESLTTQKPLCPLSSTPQQFDEGLEDPWRAAGLQSTLEEKLKELIAARTVAVAMMATE